MMSRTAGQVSSAITGVVLWELVTRAVENIHFPSPSRIVSRMHELWLSGPAENLWLTDEAIRNVPPSLIRLLSAWAMAATGGVVIGIVLGRSRRLAGYVDPILQFGRAIPPPLTLPFFMALFSGGARMQIATIVFGIVWPILLNSVDGARHVDPQYVETARVFGIPAIRRLLWIVLPASSPKIFAGLRLSLSLALILMVISEAVGTSEGIGFALLNAQRVFDDAAVWSGIVLLGLLGLMLNASFLLVERWVLRWRPDEG